MKKILLITTLLLLPFSLFASNSDITKSKGITQDVIEQLTPMPTQEDVSRYVQLSVSFNVPLDAKHVKKSDVKLKCLSCKKKNNIKGTVAYSETENRVTFTPKETLIPGLYEVEFKSLKSDKAHKSTKIKEIKYRFVVTEEVLERITVKPSRLTLIEGETQSLTVTGHYDNGTQKEISALVEWSIGDIQVISVNTDTIVTAFKAGNTTLKAKLTDVVEAGQVVSNEVFVEVLIPDVVPPVITLNGESNMTITQDDMYEELGATALDERDGDVNVTITGNVDTSVVGTYTITYTAIDSSGNGASVSRVVNVESNANKIKSLTLSASQTHFIREKETEIHPYYPIVAPLKVIATYEDGESEEVTDMVTWDSTNENMIPYGTQIKLPKGDFSITASLDGVTSNSVVLKVEDDDKVPKFLRVKVSNNNKESYPNRNTYIQIALVHKPTADVKVKLRLKESDGVRFYTPIFGEKGALTKEITFAPSQYRHYVPENLYILEHELRIVDHDRNNTSPYTIEVEPLESLDAFYDGKDPTDIVVEKQQFSIIEPPLQQRRGAIRGVTIMFQLHSKGRMVECTLLNSPEGMKIVGGSDFGMDDTFTGVDVEWKVPMDAEEGKIYNITAKAIDIEGESSEITFPIKVPKTTAIQTKIENNELTVIDTNSNLYGMKMKGHSGEDISELGLRSVEYRDVWKKEVINKQPEDVIERTVFILDNIPEKLDLKFPAYIVNYEKRSLLGATFLQYSEIGALSSAYWERAYSEGYNYEETKGLVIPSRYSSVVNSSKIFILTISKSQNRNK